MSLRTFIALDLDEPIRRKLMAVRDWLVSPADRVRLVESRNLHVTLNFLGDVPDGLAGDVCSIVQQAADRIEPFSFEVRGIQVVPPAGAVRMLWAKVSDSSGQMAKLYEQLSLGLAGLGLRGEDRRFKPHVTIMRIKSLKAPAAMRHQAREYADELFGLQHADEVVAYTSQLGSAGAVYTPMMRAELGR